MRDKYAVMVRNCLLATLIGKIGLYFMYYRRL